MTLDFREEDPKAARFNAITQSILFALVGCIVGFVAAETLVGIGEPAGWLIVASATAAGAFPIVQWARRERGHAELFDIDASLRPLVLRAASTAERIERTTAAAPAGPVAELLDENHHSALAHVKLLEHDARVGGAARKPEILSVCQQLDKLATESERLLHTALKAQPTVLHALTERTALVNDALLGELLLDDVSLGEVPLGDLTPDRGTSEASGEGDHADRGATNDH